MTPDRGELSEDDTIIRSDSHKYLSNNFVVMHDQERGVVNDEAYLPKTVIRKPVT